MLLQPVGLNVGQQVESALASQPTTSGQPSVATSSSSVASHESLQTPSAASAASESAATQASVPVPAVVGEKQQQTSTTTPAESTTLKRSKRAASPESSNQPQPCLVQTAKALAEAVRRGETYIRLTADINIGRAAIPVKHSLVIDGDHKYTYMYNGGENWHVGLYFAASNISITFKNLKIGDPRVKNSANNYYGIAPAENLIKNSKIIVENVDYYSDRGAQPFHIRDASNQIVFRGKNSFHTTKIAGSVLVQEFAEATNFLFEEDSDTTINMENTELIGTFWPSTGPLNLTLKNRARLKVVSANALVYSDGGALHKNRITVGEGAVLDVKLTDKKDGVLMYHDHDLTIDVHKNGRFLAETVGANNFNKNSSLNLGPGAKAELKNTHGDFYKNGSGTIRLDNADELLMTSGSHGKTSPTGLSASKPTLTFAPFSTDTKGYGIYADDQWVTDQADTSSWAFTPSRIKRSPTALTRGQEHQIQAASRFKVVRNATKGTTESPKNPPVVTPAKKPGQLLLKQVPDFDFGPRLIKPETQILRPKVDGEFIIEDTRTAAAKSVKVYVKVIKPFKNGNLDVTSCLSYINRSGTEQQLSDQAVLAEEVDMTSPQSLSSQWNQATDEQARGLKLVLPVEKQKLGTFTGEFEWSVQDVPTN